jgi:hypothetical protein
MVGPMTDTFLDCTGRVSPILGTDAMSGLSFSSEPLNIPIISSACGCEITLLVPPTGNFRVGERKPVRALDENELQHAFEIDRVSTITDHFVLWFDKKNELEGSLTTFHNLEVLTELNWRFGSEKGYCATPLSASKIPPQIR